MNLFLSDIQRKLADFRSGSTAFVILTLLYYQIGVQVQIYLG